MKRFALVVAAVMMTLVLNLGTASAGWSGWYNSGNVANGATHTTYFYPGVAGNHKIEFCNDSGIYHSGYMSSYWGSSNNPNSWNWFADSDVLSSIRSQNLYSGSSDIIYKFVFDNDSGATRTFYWRFYTD